MSVFKSKFVLNEGFSPWEANESEEEKRQLQQFCNQTLPRIPFHSAQIRKNDKKVIDDSKQATNQISIIKMRIKRPHTNILIPKENNDLIERNKNVLTRVSSKVPRELVKPTRDLCNQNPKEISTGAKPLQELSIKNFITEGSRQGNKDLMTSIRKKQSSYIMKQKFIEIRRSMNLQLGIWGSINKSQRKLETPHSSQTPSTMKSDGNAEANEKQNKFVLRFKRY